MPFQLMPLPYALDALSPTISSSTLSIHHGKHHRGYVDKLNTLVTGTALATLALEDVIGARNAGVPVALIHRGPLSLFPSFPPDLPAEAAGTPVVSDLEELRALLR